MTSEVTKRFEDFDLRPELLRALARKGFDTPMPVQNSILEDETLVEGDLLVQAKTGSGKTLAFALPLLQKMDTSNRAPQILVLSPTRELAQQTARDGFSQRRTLANPSKRFLAGIIYVRCAIFSWCVTSETRDILRGALR